MANEKSITLNNLKTFKAKADATYAKKTDIAAVNNGKLTIQKNGSTVATFTANQSGNSTANITVPTKLADLSERTFSNISSRGEEYLEWGGPSHMGSLSPLGVALSEAHSVNLVAFINEKALTFEYSSDGGVTWTPYPSSIGNKSVFCTMTNGISLPIGRPNSNTDIIANKSKTRVTITALDGQNSYLFAKIKKMLLYVSTASAISLLVETRTGTNYNKNGAWDTVGTYSLGGWSGWNDIPLQITLGGYVGQTTNNYQLRLTASCPEISSLSSKEGKLLSLKLFGDTCWIPANSFGTEGKIYAFDINKNVTFPSFVSASSFFEGGKNLEEKYLYKGTSSTVVNQIVYNPVEMKKTLTVPSVQGTKYTDNSGHQQSLFTLGGTVSGSGNTSQGSSSLTLYRNRAGSWDSASITFTPADGLKINNYAVGVQNWNNIPGSYILTNGDGVTKDRNGCVKLKSSSGVTSDDFVFESTYNGKLHSKMSIGPSGLVRGGWCIDNKPIATEREVAGAIGGWTLMRSVGTKVYSYLPKDIKPSTSTHAASGAPASAGKCLVDVSFFKKQGSLDGTTYPFFKTVVDVTYQGPGFELTPFAVRIGAIPYAYKWYMPRIIVSRGSMNSAWFDYMMKSLAGQADGNLVGITFEDVTVARQLLSGNLGANGIVAPQGGLNEDGVNLFTILMELDTANDGNLAVTGCHYRIVLTHPDNVLMPDE